MHRALLLCIASIVPAALVACGQAPVPVEGSQAMPASPHGAGLPPQHPPIEGAQGGAQSGQMADARFAGVVRLRGELADREEGYVFVSVKPEGIKMPCYSRKYSLSDPAVGAEQDGERVLRFELDQSNTMGGLVPGNLVLEAWFDEDGFVETKDDGVIESVPTTANDTSIEVVLER